MKAMDQFGAAIWAAMAAASTALRATGRTRRMVAGLEPGDMVVFSTEIEAAEADRLAKASGKLLRFIVAKPGTHPLDVRNRAASFGGSRRLVFDHAWIEQRYRLELQRVADDMARASEPFGPSPADQARGLSAAFFSPEND